MRFTAALAALVALAAAVVPVSAGEFQAVTGQLVPGRCHMNACSWAVFDSVEPVIETKRGALFHLQEHYFSAEYPDGDYSRRRPRKAEGAGESYVICSKTRPAMIDKGDGKGWYVTPLAPGDEGQIFGFNETALADYYAACHGMIVHDVYAGAAAARSMGYPAHVESLPDQSQVAEPAEALVKP